LRLLWSMSPQGPPNDEQVAPPEQPKAVSALDVLRPTQASELDKADSIESNTGNLQDIEKEAKENARQENLKVMARLEAMNEKLPGFAITLGEGDERFIFLGHPLMKKVVLPTANLRGTIADELRMFDMKNSSDRFQSKQLLGDQVEVTYQTALVATQEGFDAIATAVEVVKPNAIRSYSELPGGANPQEHWSNQERISLQLGLKEGLKKHDLYDLLSQADQIKQISKGAKGGLYGGLGQASAQDRLNWFKAKVGLEQAPNVSANENGEIQFQGNAREVTRNCPQQLVVECVQNNRQEAEKELRARKEVIAASQAAIEKANAVSRLLDSGIEDSGSTT
jgi:hypothetical protein